MSYLLDFGEFDLGYLSDLHVHSGSEEHDLACARSARTAGMKAVLLRSNSASTLDRAARLSETLPGIAVFGAYRPLDAGELSPLALDAALEQGARLVDLSACDLSSAEGLAALLQALEPLRARSAVLFTGALPAEQALPAAQAALRAGVERILLPAGLLAELEAAGLLLDGVYVEWTLAGLRHPADPAQMRALAEGMRRAGVGRGVIASGLGGGSQPSPVDALEHYLAALAAQGVSVQDVRQMAGKTPAFLLNLPERPRKVKR